MNALLSSFCFTSESTDGRAYTESWQRMPPASIRSFGESFSVDYSVFFLCDQFFIDEATIQKVQASPELAKHKTLFDALSDAGRLRVVDYRSEVAPYEAFIREAANRDVSNIRAWRDALLELVEIWKRYEQLAWAIESDRAGDEPQGPRERQEDMWNTDTYRGALRLVLSGMVPGIGDWKVRHNLEQWNKGIPEEYKNYTRSVVSPYFHHVAATMCLSDVLGAAIYDWADIAPLYRRKVEQACLPSQLRLQDGGTSCRKLIDLMFPDFEPQSAKHLAAALNDRRIESLRSLVDQAVRGAVEFDFEFATRTLREVLRAEEVRDSYRSIVGWLSMPLSFVPWIGNVTEKGTQMIAERFINRRAQKGYEWFYLLREIHGSV